MSDAELSYAERAARAGLRQQTRNGVTVFVGEPAVVVTTAAGKQGGQSNYRSTKRSK